MFFCSPPRRKGEIGEKVFKKKSQQGGFFVAFPDHDQFMEKKKKKKPTASQSPFVPSSLNLEWINA